MSRSFIPFMLAVVAARLVNDNNEKAYLSVAAQSNHLRVRTTQEEDDSRERSTSPYDLREISKHEKKIYSQNGEDGVLEYLCQQAGCSRKFYVEFGAHDCRECNSRYLRSKGSTGLVMDGSHENSSINLHKEYITLHNIIDLFKKYNVPREFDILSVDVDGIDFYLLRKIFCSRQYDPLIVVVEYNRNIPASEGEKVVPLNDPPIGLKKHPNGMSIGAVQALGAKFGYSVVYTNSNGVNAYLVKKSVIPANFSVDLAKLDRSSTSKEWAKNTWKNYHWNDTTAFLTNCEELHP